MYVCIYIYIYIHTYSIAGQDFAASQASREEELKARPCRYSILF